MPTTKTYLAHATAPLSPTLLPFRFPAPSTPALHACPLQPTYPTNPANALVAIPSQSTLPPLHTSINSPTRPEPPPPHHVAAPSPIQHPVSSTFPSALPLQTQPTNQPYLASAAAPLSPTLLPLRLSSVREVLVSSAFAISAMPPSLKLWLWRYRLLRRVLCCRMEDSEYM